MKTRLVVNLVATGVVAGLAVAVLVFLHSVGNVEAFNVVLGVVLGAAATTILQALSRRTDRLLRARASSALVRSDLYAYQDWILQSLKASSWTSTPTDTATVEHFAELAYATPKWRRWAQLSRARRYVSQLVSQSETSMPADVPEHAWETFSAINDARVVLARLDDGPSQPHRATEEVRRLTQAIAAGARPRRGARRFTRR